MSDEIINRVANSKLEVFDLEDYFPEGNYQTIDIKNWLFEGLVLREKEFRSAIESHNWENYKDAYVALYCSTDAIVPSWAYLLIASHLNPYARKVFRGDLEELRSILYSEILKNIDYTPYENKAVIIKGCSRKPVPENAYLWLLEKLQPIAKKIMYGEACSAVPICKKSNK